MSPRLKSIIVASLALSAYQSASAALAWGTAPGETIKNTDGITLLPGDSAAPPVAEGRYDGLGYFVQLLWDQDNDGPDAIDFTPNGVLLGTEGNVGGDVVIGSAYINRGGTVDFAPGIVPVQPSVTEQGTAGSNQSYFMRAFNVAAPTTAPWKSSTSPGFDSALPGALPVPSGATHYGNSALFTTSVANATTTETALFAGFSTTLPVSTTVIPEPTTAGLLGMGMLGVIAALRKHKQQA